jgi:hypothetical protein
MRRVLIALAVYVASHGVFRFANQQVWATNGVSYVLYPSDKAWVYYLFRPMAYLDGALTGTQTHTGPHRTPVR